MAAAPGSCVAPPGEPRPIAVIEPAGSRTRQPSRRSAAADLQRRLLRDHGHAQCRGQRRRKRPAADHDRGSLRRPAGPGGGGRAVSPEAMLWRSSARIPACLRTAPPCRVTLLQRLSARSTRWWSALGCFGQSFGPRTKTACLCRPSTRSRSTSRIEPSSVTPGHDGTAGARRDPGDLTRVRNGFGSRRAIARDAPSISGLIVVRSVDVKRRHVSRRSRHVDDPTSSRGEPLRRRSLGRPGGR